MLCIGMYTISSFRHIGIPIKLSFFVIANEMKQSTFKSFFWIASSFFLAMTTAQNKDKKLNLMAVHGDRGNEEKKSRVILFELKVNEETVSFFKVSIPLSRVILFESVQIRYPLILSPGFNPLKSGHIVRIHSAQYRTYTYESFNPLKSGHIVRIIHNDEHYANWTYSFNPLKSGHIVRI